MPSERTTAGVERAVRLMADRVGAGEVPSLEELAEAAALSKYHFHRVYRLLTGETSSQTLARLRLARGVQAVALRSFSVTDAALAAGYGSSQAFAKALRQHLSQTPSSLRGDPERLASVLGSLETRGERPDGDAGTISVEIASLDPFKVVAVRTAGRYPELASTYVSLYDALGGAAAVRRIIGIPHGNAACGLGGELVFDCGFELNRPITAVPAESQLLQVAGGLCLVSRHTGSYSRLPATLNHLYRIVLASPSLSLADRPCVFHYLDDPERTREPEWRTDVHVPITLRDND